jgi:predicted DNA-binding transcriptional regulator AlpA
MAATHTAELRFLGLPKVLERMDVSKSTWYDLVKDGAAPKPCKLGRKSVWVEAEIDAFMHGRMQERIDTPLDDDEL